MQYTLSTNTICTECSESRAKKVVAKLQELGWNIVFGKVTNIPKNNIDFTQDFYNAIDRVDYKWT